MLGLTGNLLRALSLQGEIDLNKAALNITFATYLGRGAFGALWLRFI